MPDQNSPPYDPAAYPRFAVTVDIALFTIRRGAIHTALVRRGEWPFEGRWALPGGFVREHEDLDQAAARELSEETGLRPDDSWYLEQLRAYGTPGRDPRLRVVTVAYLAVCAGIPLLRAGGDADFAQLTPVQALELGLLAFDHAQIVSDALERIRSNLEYTTLATMFLPPVFTIGDVRKVYEAVWGTPLDRANFQRNFRRNRSCFVEYQGPPPERTRQPGHPPKQWWSLKSPRRPGEPVSFLDHPLLGSREARRQRRATPLSTLATSRSRSGGRRT